MLTTHQPNWNVLTFSFFYISIRSTQIMNGRKAVANEHLFGCHHRVMISIHHFRDESQVNWICHWAIIFSVAVLKQVKVLSRNNTLRWSGLIVLHLRNTHSVARVYHQYKKWMLMILLHSRQFELWPYILPSCKPQTYDLSGACVSGCTAISGCKRLQAKRYHLH